MAFCSARSRRRTSIVGFVMPLTMTVIYSGIALFHPFVELRNNPEFLPLMNRDRTNWPRCLLWHGWLPGLTSRSSGSPWAVASSDLASHNLEKGFGSLPSFYPFHLASFLGSG